MYSNIVPLTDNVNLRLCSSLQYYIFISVFIFFIQLWCFYSRSLFHVALFVCKESSVKIQTYSPPPQSA